MANMELLRKAMEDLEEDTVLELIRHIAASGGGESGAAMEACQEGMKVVGDRFEAGEYFIGDLIFAGEIMTGALEILKPFLNAGITGGRGKMILCTVQGDLHDIGKNIVSSVLVAAGFEVIDLGIDVAPETVLETAKAENIKIIALSGVLTLALDSMRDVVDLFKSAGLRDSVKIIIGGNPVTAEACAKIGADAWAHSPQKGASVCSAWASEA